MTHPESSLQHEYRKRGQHKIFLGYAPGVGKTYTMLAEAHRRVRRGEDVVVGIVETHQRAETEALLAKKHYLLHRKLILCLHLVYLLELSRLL